MDRGLSLDDITDMQEVLSDISSINSSIVAINEVIGNETHFSIDFIATEYFDVEISYSLKLERDDLHKLVSILEDKKSDKENCMYDIAEKITNQRKEG